MWKETVVVLVASDRY